MKSHCLKIAFLSSLVAIITLLAGCSSPPMSINYAPSSILSAEGSVTVSDFTYSASTNDDIKPNQIKNTAMGTYLFDKDVATIYKEAVFKELRFIGVKTENPNLELTGDIQKFLIDDLGFTVDWTLRVRYKIQDKNTSTVLYDEVKTVTRKTPKFVNSFGVLNEVIKENIENLIKDEKFKSVIKQ